ncbi:Hypothetical predicted protein [Cloeon dipterum]|uniref:TMEM248/TMEM219 domain-containing protein n=1 Tax=Cloeon dipterum TaxID=197152 RepID=A0A8S1C5M0_9INSE|nr:Hypothetical predicted protein [Cloeon dipterum]
MARYIDHYDNLPDPDYPYDWSKILKNMADLELCAQPEKSNELKSETKTDKSGSEQKIVSMTAAIQLPPIVHNKLSNYTKISGNVAGTLLGLDGSGVEITISFVLVTNGSSDHSICATFTGPQSKMPSSEYAFQCQSNQIYPVEKYSQFNARLKDPKNDDPKWCLDGTELQLDYIRILPLKESDKEIIKMHLMHTSFFLLSIALALICYAIVNGRKTHIQIGDHAKVPLGL